MQEGLVVSKNTRRSGIRVALASLILPGLGQFINHERLKALLWFALPVFLIAVEMGTSEWGRYFALLEGKSIAYAAQSSAVSIDQGGQKGQAASSLGDILASSQKSSSSAQSDDASLYGDTAPATDKTETATQETAPGYDWPNYKANPAGQNAYIIRDFGGFFTRGIWGLVTMGRLVIGQNYAGSSIELYDFQSRWRTADNSIVLIGNGLIALIVLLLSGFFWILGIIDAWKTRLQLANDIPHERFRDFIKRSWESFFVYLGAAPAFILMLLFTVIPILFTFLLAFTNYTYKIKLGTSVIQWAGFDTFSMLAMDPGWLAIFGQIFLWTVLWAFLSTFTVYALGFVNAMVIESPNVKGKRFWRTILILPWAIPALVSLMMFKNAFDKDGLVNQFLFSSGLMQPMTDFLYHIGLEGRPDQPIFWFQPVYNGALAKSVVVLVNLWLGAPYHMMMIIGILSTISRDLYEAAAIDGVSRWQRFRYITFPMVIAATAPNLIMTFSFNFNNFGAVYFLTGGGPAWVPSQVPDSMRIISSALPGQTDILISWIYKLSFTKDFEQYNIAAVYSILIFFIVGGLSVFNMVRTKSFQEEIEE